MSQAWDAILEGRDRHVFIYYRDSRNFRKLVLTIGEDGIHTEDMTIHYLDKGFNSATTKQQYGQRLAPVVDLKRVGKWTDGPLVPRVQDASSEDGRVVVMLEWSPLIGKYCISVGGHQDVAYIGPGGLYRCPGRKGWQERLAG